MAGYAQVNAPESAKYPVLAATVAVAVIGNGNKAALLQLFRKGQTGK